MTTMGVLLLGYVFLVTRFVRRNLAHLSLKCAEDVLVAERRVKNLEERRACLRAKKIELENEAIEIFTLYEITREITQSANESEAFNLFKEKITHYMDYKECLFLKPCSKDVCRLKTRAGWMVFPLKGKRKKIGYLAIEGLRPEDKDKFTILAQQFALALRRVQLYAEIEKVAITDSLTELYTRRYAMDRLREELKRASLQKIPMSFLMLDVDFFKRLNDEHGHLTGDQVLREIGRIIQNNIREIDIAGRYGGEEFCVILPDTDQEGAYYAAERMRVAAEKTSIKAYDTKVKVTVSVGTATFPDDGAGMEEIIDKADWALYRAKKQGRNRVCSFGKYPFADNGFT